MTEKATVDFARVMENAAKEEIDLQQIAIQYEGLTDAEMVDLRITQTVTHEPDDEGGRFLAKFPEDGSVPKYPHKATAVFYLGS